MKLFLTRLLFFGLLLSPFLIQIDCQQLLAHEIRPAYLELAEISAGRFDILWKQPIRQGRGLNVSPTLPDNCKPLGMHRSEVTPDALIKRWTVDCSPDGINGRQISIVGLNRTLTNVMVRIQYRNGNVTSEVLSAGNISFVVFQKEAKAPWDYLQLGIVHLLSGFDHILFVIGLMFLVRRPMLLVKTITAFTVAHSITLGLSALGLVLIPQSPIEALIALSILFLAFELTRKEPVKNLTAQYPWLIAFVFGLLHGFGFASVLSNIGLPESAAILALFLFNVGVEIGQLILVAVILVILRGTKPWRRQIPFSLTRVPIYGMGVISAFWLIERILS
jgi:hypothetical protein